MQHITTRLISVLTLISLAGCVSVNHIEDGVYTARADQGQVDYARIEIDKENHRVLLYPEGSANPLSVMGHPLDRGSWREDCHTNTSREVLESWALSETTMTVAIAILHAGCFGEGVTLGFGTKNVWYE